MVSIGVDRSAVFREVVSLGREDSMFCRTGNMFSQTASPINCQTADTLFTAKEVPAGVKVVVASVSLCCFVTKVLFRGPFSFGVESNGFD